MARPREALISPASAVDAAIRIIDAEGLDSFSLPRLARELGVRAPSLYHHFADRSAILSAVSHEIISATVIPRKPSDPERWPDYLVQLALNFRAAILRHRNAAPILVQFPPHAELIGHFEDVAEHLARSGVPDHLIVRVLEGVENLSVSATVSEALQPPATRTAIFPGTDPDAQPYLTRALKNNAYTPKQLLEAEIRAFLHGLRATAEVQ